uniref:Uncharacterized protein n=1 Tax=Magallana gigas TaxID=29159 RepID=A0A8W8NGW0_MAGGI
MHRDKNTNLISHIITGTYITGPGHQNTVQLRHGKEGSCDRGWSQWTARHKMLCGRGSATRLFRENRSHRWSMVLHGRADGRTVLCNEVHSHQHQ